MGRGVESFRLADGIKLTGADMFARYADTLQIKTSTDSFIALGTPRANFLSPQYGLSFYRQHYKNLPVGGYGYYVFEAEGITKICSGKFMPELDLSATPSINADTAYWRAVNQVASYPLPWEQFPGTYTRPSARLMITSLKSNPRPEDFILVQRVDFAGSGIKDVSFVDINAFDNSIVRVEGLWLYCNMDEFTPAGSQENHLLLDPAIDIPFPTRIYNNTTEDYNFLLREEPYPIIAHHGSVDTFHNNILCSQDLYWDTEAEKIDALAYTSLLDIDSYLTQMFPVLPESFVPGAPVPAILDGWIGTEGRGGTTLRLVVDEDPSWDYKGAKFTNIDAGSHNTPIIYLNPESAAIIQNNLPAPPPDDNWTMQFIYKLMGHEVGHAV